MPDPDGLTPNGQIEADEFVFVAPSGETAAQEPENTPSIATKPSDADHKWKPVFADWFDGAFGGWGGFWPDEWRLADIA
jgi:hypothetical protein